MSRPLAAWSRAILACLLALVLAQPAQATGWVVVLKNTPAEDFNDEDIQQFLSAAVKLLNAPGEGPAPDVAWQNAATFLPTSSPPQCARSICTTSAARR